MGDNSRGLAICTECGRKYAARQVASGGLNPIGCPAGCKSCGCTEFEAFSPSDVDSERPDLRG
ncbi:hypothetical protein [Natronococcus occultus]|uniref:Uncharacterized protein n=1 Tax=Natronococcus occultus SP4 TaxID=694430 RepID=L0K5W4_9EURY|nr:hypothetical protein [Natronococcus occultus]AGB39513.1 hypothetical protein Natoc_3807 [Natronococcus occultus SP4]